MRTRSEQPGLRNTWLVITVIGIAIACVVATIGLRRSIVATVAWIGRDFKARSEDDGAAQLFRDLVAQRIIRLHSDGQLRVDDCECDRTSTAKACRDPSLMRRLCQTATGRTISAEVDAWNRVGQVLAVRDSRHANAPDWTFRFAEGGALGLTQPAVPGLSPSPLIFAQAVDYTPYGDWSAIDLTGVAGHALRLSTGLEGIRSGSQLKVQVTGTLTAFTFLAANGQPLAGLLKRVQPHLARLVLCQPTEVGRAATDAARVDEVQETGDDHILLEPTRADCPMRTIFASVPISRERADYRRPKIELAEFTIPAGASRLEIDVVPQRVMPRSLQRFSSPVWLKPHRLRGERERFPVRYQVASLALRCGAVSVVDKKVARCLLDWITPKPGTSPLVEDETAPRDAVTPKVTITARDGTTLLATTVDNAPANPPQAAKSIAPQALATDGARDLGLSGFIGAFPGDSNGLAAQALLAGRNGTPINLKLTIDPTLQAAAQKTLKSLLVDRQPQSIGGLLKDSEAGLPATRRGNIVILSAEEKTAGEILAVANWPAPESHARLNAWDIAAIETGSAARSPIASRAWADSDQQTTPGSTFKVVSALALLQAVADGTEGGFFSDMVRGVSVDDFVRRVGIETTCLRDGKNADCYRIGPQDRRGITNNDGLPFVSANKPFECSLQAFADNGTSDSIGLRQALATSSNIYFASLIDRLPKPADPAKHHLAVAIDRLYGHQSFSLIDETSLGGRSSPRTQAQRIIADFLQAENLIKSPGARGDLVRASFGHTVQAPPVSIAAIMAGIALGQRVIPVLEAGHTKAAPAEPLIASTDVYLANRLMNELRCGLKGVVQTGGSGHTHTAADLQPLMYAKTGTARIKGSKLHTVWFAGWLEPDPKSADTKPGHGRIAFACMITHASTTGGSICAPLISQLMSQLRHGSSPAAPGGRRKRTP